ncbi:MAG: hypothetical protein ACE5JX_20445 [Acidobacteriota bacterium]
MNLESQREPAGLGLEGLLRSRLFRALRVGWALLPLLTAPLAAGGPLVSGPGDAFRWPPGQPVNFIIDKGPLRSGGSPLSSEEGARVVRDAIGVWGSLPGSQSTPVPTSSLTFEDRGFLDEDVDDSNFERFMSDFGGGNPIIFDADHTIINLVFGEEAGANILGFAGAFDTDGDGFLDFGRAVLNGTKASLGVNTQFRTTVIHELGHMLGLGHTQAGREFFDQCNVFQPTPCGLIPIMYPVISGGPTHVVHPLRDDQAWISWIYPTEDFSRITGAIRGTVRRSTGAPFQGAHVVAVPVTVSGDEITELDEGMVSGVSDFLVRFDGSFELPGLEPVSYVVFIEPLNSGFTGGSGVGPFDTRFTDFPKDYYNGINESGQESDPTEKVVIAVTAGQTVEGIDLVSDDRNDEDLATIGDDDSRSVLFGFSFPFFGKVYDGAFVNSDGNLTFESPDLFSSSRSEARFQGGPPRIAPLFTDLNPEVTGEITLEQLEGSVRLSWTDVPEFGSTAGNNFWMELFGNGNILFHYENISVSADLDGIQAIVGITPGHLMAGGDSSDFSSQPQPIAILAAPLFQVFTGTSFDLTGDLLFEATESQFFLFFPFNRGNREEFTGFAVVNDADLEALLRVEGLAPGGERQDYPDNPHLEALESHRKIARLGSEFFATDPATERDGWVRIGSNLSQLASFFQFGSGPGGTVSSLDGSVAFTDQSKKLYFTRIADGPDGYSRLVDSQPDFQPVPPVPVAARTFLSLANPNSEVIHLTFTRFNPLGGTEGDPVKRDLNPLGCLRESFTSLFGEVGTVFDGYVRVDVEGPGAVGFEWLQLEDTVLGINASFGNDSSVSYSAQLAHGELGGVAIFTSLKLINISADPRDVTLVALREDGTELNRTSPLRLNPGQSLQRTVGDLFQLGAPAGASTAGSIVVEATGPGIIGDVVFGDPDRGRYAAALPLQTRLFTRAIFPQVANSDNPNPALATFTGLALYNPSPDQTAQVTIRVLKEEGILKGQTQAPIQLGPRQRLSDVLSVLVPESAGQVRGYVEVLSTEPLVAQQLFGDLTLDFLSAVPPTVVE